MEEDAKQLVYKFYAVIPRLGDFKQNWECAKQCAIIHISEMRSLISPLDFNEQQKIDYDCWHLDNLLKEIDKL